MDREGPFTFLVELFLAPLQWRQMRARKLRSLSPHELNLRRATHPLGVLAVLSWFGWLFGGRDLLAIAPLFLDPLHNWLPAMLLAAVLLYALASFMVGIRNAWGMRSDRMLPVGAFMRMAVGGGGFWFLWTPNTAFTHAVAATPRLGMLWPFLVALSIWWATVGGARLIFLTVSGGSALRKMTSVIATKNAPMIGARRHRSWWSFLKFW